MSISTRIYYTTNVIRRAYNRVGSVLRVVTINGYETAIKFAVFTILMLIAIDMYQ